MLIPGLLPPDLLLFLSSQYLLVLRFPEKPFGKEVNRVLWLILVGYSHALRNDESNILGF